MVAQVVQAVRFDVVQSEVVDSQVMLQVSWGFAHVEGQIVSAVMVEFISGSQYLYHGNADILAAFLGRVQAHINEPSVVRLGAYFNANVRQLPCIRVN